MTVQERIADLTAALTAGTPERVLGPTSHDARRAFRRLAVELHPDRNDDPDAAEAFQVLNALWSLATTLINAGMYATGVRPVKISTRTRDYTILGPKLKGDIADVYPCVWDGDVPGRLKIARVPRDNDLIEREARILRSLVKTLDVDFHPFLPSLVESVGVRQSGGVVRRANVFAELDGFYTLEEVTRRRGKIDPRDMAWMFHRILFLLGAVHEQGVVHGGVLPQNVMIHPEKHGLVLLDWCYAGAEGSPATLITGRTRWCWPPEISLDIDRSLCPGTDVFMAAETALSLIDRPPAVMSAFFRACLLAKNRRLSDAVETRVRFLEMIERLYGPRRFRRFSM